MKKILTGLIVLSLFISCGKESKPVSGAVVGRMSHAQVDSMLRVNSTKNYTVTERIRLYSELFLNTPYSWHATGDGPYALYESWPLVSLDSTNCMVYCEHVLAMAISDSWDHFFNNLQQIRYQNGIIGMKTRNHYTMADWRLENDWILNDVSAKVGGDYTRKMTRIISHENFFRGKGLSDLRYVKPDRKITVDYVPMEHLADVKENIRNGDIVALLYAHKQNVFSAHMLMIIEKDGKLFFREASTSNYSTFETEFHEWLDWKGGWDRYAGIAFMRVKPQINKPNAVILPHKISDLKD